jgi:hypothetical protein
VEKHRHYGEGAHILSKDRGKLTRILASAGTVLVSIPILAPVLLGAVFLIHSHVLRLDWLMPAELFPVVLLGAGLLLWAARRAGSRGKLIAWALGIAILSLVGGQALAVITGLATGATEPMGWPWTLVVASLALYTAAVAALAVGGIMLLRDLFPHVGVLPDQRT